MAKILVIHEKAIVRDPISAGLQVAGHQTEMAATGKEALAKARASPPDLVMLDAEMAGMGGLELVEAMRGDAALKGVRVILLTAQADRQTVVRAAQLGIRDCMLKSRFSMAELLERVGRLVAKVQEKPESGRAVEKITAEGAAGELPQLLSRDQCLSRVERATSARPMSGVVGQVLAMASSPLVEMSEMAGLIGRDPLLSARVLRAANSAGFCGGRKVVSTIHDAVRNIGLSTVRNIAAALSAYEAIPCGGADGFHYMRSWQHSFATAIICQKLVEVSSPAEAGAAYLVGLCHDLGQILFRSEFGKEYAQVLAAVARTGRGFDEIERQMLGTTQLDLARIILKRMSLPEAIRQPIEEFHTLRNCAARQKNGVAAQGSLALTRVLHLADLYANGVMMAALTGSEVGCVNKTDCRSAVGRDEPAAPNADEVRGQILALTPLLARLPEAEERTLCLPLLAGTGKRAWLTRDVAFSAFDPLEAALRSLGEVKASDQLPKESEHAKWDLLVVASRQRYPLRETGGMRIVRLATEDAPAQAAAEGNVEERGAMISLEKLAGLLTMRPAAAGEVMRKAA